MLEFVNPLFIHKFLNTIEEERLQNSMRDELADDEDAATRVGSRSAAFNALEGLAKTALYDLIAGDLFIHRCGEVVLSGDHEGRSMQRMEVAGEAKLIPFIMLIGSLGLVPLVLLQTVNLIKLALSLVTVLPYLVYKHGLKQGLEKIGRYVLEQLDTLVATLIGMIMLVTVMPIAGFIALLPFAKWNAQKNVEAFNRNHSLVQALLDNIDANNDEQVRASLDVIWNNTGFTVEQKQKYFEAAMLRARDKDAVLAELINTSELDMSVAGGLERVYSILVFLMDHKYQEKKQDILAASQKLCGDIRFHDFLNTPNAGSRHKVIRYYLSKRAKAGGEELYLQDAIAQQLLTMTPYFEWTTRENWGDYDEMLKQAVDAYLDKLDEGSIDFSEKANVDYGYCMLGALIERSSFKLVDTEMDGRLNHMNMLLSHDVVSDKVDADPINSDDLYRIKHIFSRACELGYEHIARWLFQQCAQDKRMNILAEDDYNIFRAACTNNHQDIAQFLLEYPAVRDYARASTDDAIQRAYQSYMYHSTMGLTAFASASFFKQADPETGIVREGLDEDSPAHVLNENVISVIAGFVNGV
jgi:hypothetical protein